MFGKLLKYDFRSMWKQFAFIWPAALVLALINRFTLPMVDRGSSFSDITGGLTMLLYIAILMAMFVAAIVFVIQRFYKGLLGDEGYLMHTLPVHPWQLIVSKLTCATALTIASILVAILSIFLILPMNLLDVAQMFRQLVEVLHKLVYYYQANVPLLLVEIIVMALVGLVTGILQLYLAMAVGHLFGHNRIAASVIAYVLINAAISVVTNILGLAVALPYMGQLDRLMEDWAAWHIFIWLIILYNVVLGVVFFFTTEHILRKRLNLE